MKLKGIDYDKASDEQKQENEQDFEEEYFAEVQRNEDIDEQKTELRNINERTKAIDSESKNMSTKMDEIK